MGIENLAVLNRPNGEVEFSCPECHGIATPNDGVADKEQLAYLLVCSKCRIILGQWPTAQERAQDLKVFAEKAKRELSDRP